MLPLPLVLSCLFYYSPANTLPWQVWEAFWNRTAEDLRRREDDREAWNKLRETAMNFIDPECTFSPQLANLPRSARAFPHLRDTADRLEHQTFAERMEETLARRHDRHRMAQAAAPDTSQLPDYTKAAQLNEILHPARTFPSRFDADAAGYGGNLIAHGPFDTDMFGRPLAAPSRAEPKGGASTANNRADSSGSKDNGGEAPERANRSRASAKHDDCASNKESARQDSARSRNRPNRPVVPRAEAKSDNADERGTRSRHSAKGTGDVWMKE